MATQVRRRSRLRSLLLLALLALGGLAAVLVVNAVRYAAGERAEAVEAVQPPVDAQAAAARLAGALRFPTVSHQEAARVDSGAFRGLHAYLAEAFPRVHAALRRDTVGGLSLLYTWPGQDSTLEAVLLMAHQDVVPADDSLDARWRHPPFAGVVAEGAVWGRGALDDKSGVVGMLEAAELLLAEGFRPRRTVYLAFGHDEEVGGARGAAAIAARLQAEGRRLAFVLDEGGLVTDGAPLGLGRPVALVGVAEKGYLSLTLSAEDAGGHSSTPPRLTAAGRVARAVAALQANPFSARLDGATALLFDAVGPHLPFAQRLAFANLWLMRPLVLQQLAAQPTTDAMIRTTTAPTMLQGSAKDNVLPTRATAVVNFRILPGETVAGVTERARRVVGDAAVALAPLGVAMEPSPVSDVGGEAYRMLAHTIRQTAAPDVLVAPYLVVGATDSRHFLPLTASVFRFNGAAVTPEELDGMHGLNERVSVAAYARAVGFFYQLLRNTDTL